MGSRATMATSPIAGYDLQVPADLSNRQVQKKLSPDTSWVTNP